MENNKQLIFFLSALGFVIIAISVFILIFFSNNKQNTNQATTTSSSSSSVSSVASNGLEQIPERITDFIGALPFRSQEFNVDYDSQTNEVVVTSTMYDKNQLPAVFKNWIKRFPNLNINSLKVKYIGNEAQVIDKIKGS
ncbi:MAG: hypothetical protein WCO33_01175 [bacterium]